MSDSTVEKGLEEKMEELVEEKVERRVEKRVKRELEKHGLGPKNSSNKKEESLSRRSFLKKLGIGAIGLGALGISNASALNMRSNDFTFYGADNTEEFQINDGGPVEVKNADLDVGSNSVKTNNFEIVENSSTNSLDFNFTG